MNISSLEYLLEAFSVLDDSATNLFINCISLEVACHQTKLNFLKKNREGNNQFQHQNLAQILRIKKGSKTKCLETLTGVAPLLDRSCSWNSIIQYTIIRKLES